MVQGPPQAPPPRTLMDDATVQMLRLLAVVTTVDLVFRRASNAVLGLRLSEESSLLRGFNELSPRETDVLDVLIVAAVLATGLVCVDLLRRTDVRSRIGGLLGLVAAAWTIVWRLEGRSDPTLPPAIGLGMIIAAAVMVAPAIPLLPALAGGALASLWIMLARGAEGFEGVERAAEVALAAGIFIAWSLLAARHGRPGRWGWSLTVASGLIVLGTYWLNAPAWRHVVVHVFRLHTAGVPTPLLCGLLSLAVMGLVGLATSGPAMRGLALGLFLLLASARGPEPELVALRVAAAVAIAWAWTRAAARDLVGQNPPVNSSESSSSSSSSSPSAKGSSEDSGSCSASPTPAN